MSFPLTYTKTLEFDNQVLKKNGVALTNFVDVLLQNLHLFIPKDLEFTKSGLKFKSNYSLVRFQYEVNLEITASDEIEMKYSLDLSQLAAITFFIALFITFFSRYSIWAFVMYSILISVVFYSVNLWFINVYLKKAFRKTVDQIFPQTNEQDLWLHDPNRCPACGENITRSDIFCPSCDLRLKPGKRKPKPKPLPEKRTKIVYHYKQ